jgi:hypothetical protein
MKERHSLTSSPDEGGGRQEPLHIRNRAKARKRHRALRRFGLILMVLGIFLGIGRAFLPAIVRDYVNRTLDRNLLYEGRIGDVQVHLWRGAYSISDMADHWRGWDGEKKHESLEGHLRIVCTRDSVGHITARIRLRGDMMGANWVAVDTGGGKMCLNSTHEEHKHTSIYPASGLTEGDNTPTAALRCISMDQETRGGLTAVFYVLCLGIQCTLGHRDI